MAAVRLRKGTASELAWPARATIAVTNTKMPCDRAVVHVIEANLDVI
jgi:hypothetical protein